MSEILKLLHIGHLNCRFGLALILADLKLWRLLSWKLRWFANQQLFLLYRATLINTASVEAITARAGAGQGSAPRPAMPVVGPDAVKSFIAEITAAKVTQERATAGDNVNAYKESVHAYASETMFKDDALAAPAATAPTPGAPRSAPVAKPRSISSDFVSK